MDISWLKRGLIITLALVPGGGSAATAQGPRSAILGFVVDAQGKPIAGVPVTLINNADGQKAAPVMSEPSGLYSLLGVRAGSYQIEASLAGFRRPTVEVDVDPQDQWVVAPFLILKRGQAVVPVREIPFRR